MYIKGVIVKGKIVKQSTYVKQFYWNGIKGSSPNLSSIPNMTSFKILTNPKIGIIEDIHFL